jgi:hypothetical protein
MTRPRSTMFPLFALLLLAFEGPLAAPVASSWPPGDDLTATLNKEVPTYNVRGMSFLAALIRVSNDFQIPMGITWVNSPPARAKLGLTWNKVTVGQIIRDIAGTQPGYEVRARNGVLHVSATIPDEQNFLKVKIGEFRVQNEYSEMAHFKLWTLLNPRPEYGSWQMSIGGRGDSKVTIELAESTVEDVLDALGVASTQKIWVVTFTTDVRLTLRGLRRSISLWNDKPADEGPPCWDAIRWGGPMPPLAALN